MLLDGPHYRLQDNMQDGLSMTVIAAYSMPDPISCRMREPCRLTYCSVLYKPSDHCICDWPFALMTEAVRHTLMVVSLLGV